MKSSQNNSSGGAAADKKTTQTSEESLRIKEAHEQADRDIENDKDFKPHPKTHDLDEGELARLDGE